MSNWFLLDNLIYLRPSLKNTSRLFHLVQEFPLLHFFLIRLSYSKVKMLISLRKFWLRFHNLGFLSSTISAREAGEGWRFRKFWGVSWDLLAENPCFPLILYIFPMFMQNYDKLSHYYLLDLHRKYSWGLMYTVLLDASWLFLLFFICFEYYPPVDVWSD